MKTKNILEKVDNFLKGITKKDRAAVIHDTDADGVCSAVIIAKCIERLRGKRVELHMPMDKKEHGLTPSILKKLRKHKINKLIALDFSAEQNLKLLKQAEKQAQILVIDHHKLYADYQTKKTILYKPQYFTKIKPYTYCTAKLAYDAANRVTDMTDLDWMAASASIGDVATKPWKKWLKKVFKKYKIKEKKDPFHTKLGQIAATIKSTEVYDIKLIPRCYQVLYKSKKPDDVLKSKLTKYKKIIDKELQKHLRLFEKKAEKHKDIRIYEMSSKYAIHSALSTIAGIKHPHQTIIIINKPDRMARVSARRSDKKKAVNLLLENAVKGFKEANAGGHVPSAGAGFPKKYLKQFKQRIIKA